MSDDVFLIIDADSLVYAACLCSKEEDEEGFIRDSNEVIFRFDESFHKIINDLYELGVYVTHYVFIVAGGNNYRRLLFSSYKANRKDKVLPLMLPFLSAYIVSKYGAFEAVGCEADDVVVATHEKLTKEGKKAIIASNDKDLKQVPCWFFDTYYQRRSLTEITKAEALRNYYTQLLIGDATDNVMGIYGLGVKKAEKLLESCTGEFSFKRAVYTQYKIKYRHKARERFIECKMLVTLNKKVNTPEFFEEL